MALEILPATTFYLNSILDIQKLCYSTDLIESSLVFKSILDLNQSWIALIGNKVIGYMLVHPWSHNHIPILNQTLCIGSSESSFIHDLSVHPDYRNTGVATALVQKASKDKVSLVAVQNSSPFWSKFGFHCRPCEIPPGYGKDAVYMSCLRECERY